MKTACPLFLEDDTIVHLDMMSRVMSQQLNRGVSRSEVVEWLVRRHWKAMQIRQGQQQGLAKEKNLTL